MALNDKAIVLARARETLGIAKQALQDARDPRRRLASIRNIVVFGRSVTNIIENLRSRVERFDDWYKPLSEEMSRDPLMKFFYKLRSEILKEGAMKTGVRLRVTIDHDEIDRLPKPPNVRGFFMGDMTGGSGWEVEVSPGVIEKYYVELPESIGTVRLMLADAPGDEKDALVLCEQYVQHMERIVDLAQKRWGG